MAKKTGCMLTTHNGVAYFVAAPDAKTGLEYMAQSQAEARTYGTGIPGDAPGCAWDDPRTRIEFGEVDGNAFKVLEVIRPKAEEAHEDAEPEDADATPLADEVRPAGL